MISTARATTFLQALRSGRTSPCLMLCEDDSGSQFEMVVKLRAGMDSGTTGLTCELLASLLASDLDLKVPRPFIVVVDPDFYEAIPNAKSAELLRKSQGCNFGSEYLKAGYTTWPQERSVPSSLMQMAADIFAFDLMIQNPDRRKDNPNVLRKGDDLVIFDHEMAFSFLYAIGQAQYPWDNPGVGFLRNHVFYDGLKGRELVWERIQGALEAIDDRRLGMYTEAVPVSWREHGTDVSMQISRYIGKVRDSTSPLFRKIREVLT